MLCGTHEIVDMAVKAAAAAHKTDDGGRRLYNNAINIGDRRTHGTADRLATVESRSPTTGIPCDGQSRTNDSDTELYRVRQKSNPIGKILYL